MLPNFRTPLRRERALLINPSAVASRDLRVVLDESTISDLESDAETVELLRGLVQGPSVRCWHYSDDGPPADERPVHPTVPAVRGWVVVREHAGEPMLTHDVFYCDGESSATAAGISGDLGRADRVASDRTYASMTDADAAARRGADSVAFGAADAAKADLLVTTRPFLLSGRWFPDRPMVCCGPRDAVALVSQFLRLRGTYVARASSAGITIRFNKGLFYWVGARALLPGAWKCIAECSNLGEAREDATLLALTVLQRIERCLVVRDAIRWKTYLPQDNDVAGDVMADLDTVMILLVGAFDVLARVAHRFRGMPGKDFRAGWQKTGWLKEIERSDKALARVMAVGGTGSDVFEVLRLLRNTVHGVALQPIGVHQYGRRQHTKAKLPRSDAARLLEISRNRNWAAEWGLEDWEEGGVHVSPEALVEHLLSIAIPTLDRIMNLLQVSPPLTQVADGAQSLALRADPNHEVFAPANQRSVLLQLGLADLPLV